MSDNLPKYVIDLLIRHRQYVLGMVTDCGEGPNDDEKYLLEATDRLLLEELGAQGMVWAFYNTGGKNTEWAANAKNSISNMLQQILEDIEL